MGQRPGCLAVQERPEPRGPWREKRHPVKHKWGSRRAWGPGPALPFPPPLACGLLRETGENGTGLPSPEPLCWRSWSLHVVQASPVPARPLHEMCFPSLFPQLNTASVLGQFHRITAGAF